VAKHAVRNKGRVNPRSQKGFARKNRKKGRGRRRKKRDNERGKNHTLIVSGTERIENLIGAVEPARKKVKKKNGLPVTKTEV